MERRSAICRNYWASIPTKDREDLTKTIIEGVMVFDNHLEIRLRLADLLGCSEDCLFSHQLGATSDSNPHPYVIPLTCPFSQIRRGHELRLIINGAEPRLTNSTTALLKGVARARLWYEQLISETSEAFRSLPGSTA